MVPISGTPIRSGVLIPFLIPEIPVRFFFLNSAVKKINKLEFRFQNLEFQKKTVGTQYTSFRTRKTVAAIFTSTQRWLLPYLHLLNTCPTIPTSTQRLSCHTYIYSTPVPQYLHLLNACPPIPTSTQCLLQPSQKKKAGMFSDS